jgi:hypothetical protein
VNEHGHMSLERRHHGMLQLDKDGRKGLVSIGSWPPKPRRHTSTRDVDLQEGKYFGNNTVIFLSVGGDVTTSAEFSHSSSTLPTPNITAALYGAF